MAGVNVSCLQLGISFPFIHIHQYFSVVYTLDEAITQHLKMIKEHVLRLNSCLSKAVL